MFTLYVGGTCPLGRRTQALVCFPGINFFIKRPIDKTQSIRQWISPFYSIHELIEKSIHNLKNFKTKTNKHRRNVSALSLYYRYYHGRCSDELKSIIPPKACFVRSTRFADSKHSFAVKLEKCWTTSFANTFVPMTSRNWNSLPASIFPSTHNLQTFKTRVHKHLRLHPLT